MSVVAAKVYTDRVAVAADSIIVKGWSKRTANFSKLIQVNNMIIGSSGTAEETSLMWRYASSSHPETATERDVLAFMVEFSKFKRELVGDGSVNNSYIIVYDGHLFEVESMFAHEVKDYVAIGAGFDFATAALYLGHSPKEAVKVACDLSCFVSEPIVEFEMTRR